MKQLKAFATMLLFSAIVSAQPSNATIQADIKKQMGSNCIAVTITGTGVTKKEFDNGAWINYFRIPVNATLKTDMAGVTRLMKGAAVYTVNSGNYQFVKYNTGSGQYEGMEAPNAEAIKNWILTLPDLALGGRANQITSVENISITPDEATWHSKISVSLKCEYTYWMRKNNAELEQITEPFELRLYRKDAESDWHAATLITPNFANDKRRKVIHGTKRNNGEKTIVQRMMEKQGIRGN